MTNILLIATFAAAAAAVESGLQDGASNGVARGRYQITPALVETVNRYYQLPEDLAFQHDEMEDETAATMVLFAAIWMSKLEDPRDWPLYWRHGKWGRLRETVDLDYEERLNNTWQSWSGKM